MRRRTTRPRRSTGIEASCSDQRRTVFSATRTRSATCRAVIDRLGGGFGHRAPRLMVEGSCWFELGVTTRAVRAGRLPRRGIGGATASQSRRHLVRGAWELRTTEHAERENRRYLFLVCSVCSVLRMSQGTRSRCGPGCSYAADLGGTRSFIRAWIQVSRAAGSHFAGSQ